MKTKWDTVKLGEVSNITKLAGFEFTKYIKYNSYGEIIALRALNLRNGFLDLSDIKRIDKEVSELLPRSKLYKGDILLTYTGNGYGDCALVDENDKYHLAPNICKVSADEKNLNHYYLYSIMRTPWFKRLLSNYIGGSGQPTIPMSTLRILEIPLPPFEKQIKFASLSKAIDRKILNNLAINENLLEQCLNVVLHFIKDKKPNAVLSDVVTENNKSKIQVNAARGVKGDYPFFTSGEAILEYDEYLVDGRNIFLNTGGNAGVKFYIGKASYSTDTWSISAGKYTDYIFLLLASMITELNLVYFEGSALKHLQKKKLLTREFYLPNDQELEELNEIITPSLDMIGNNIEQNKQLSVIRNTLTSKFMSGTLNVDKIRAEEE